MAWPRAEQWEMAEKLHMMQRPPLVCHDSEERGTNSLAPARLTPFTALTITPLSTDTHQPD